ncbi:hypothetical protein BJ742DRAFT_778275 [Cladochytrium replicatum]|nr:hypothetical protein BJ742DRAFT_778275 [Cladochytrium replicatum]
MSTNKDNLALASAGASVTMVTSADALHPPENMLDGAVPSGIHHHASAGHEPKEIGRLVVQRQVLSNRDSTSLKNQLQSQVAHWEIERSTSDSIQDFEPVGFMDPEDADTHLQVCAMTLPYHVVDKAAAAVAPTSPASNAPVFAKHVKFRIKKGFNEYCSVHKVLINGEAPGGSR